MTGMSGLLLLMAVGAIFILLLAININVVRQIPLFRDHSRLIGICVTLLEIIGLRNAWGSGSEWTISLPFLLLPYAGVALILILLFLFGLLMRFLRRTKNEAFPFSDEEMSETGSHREAQLSSGQKRLPGRNREE